MRRAVLVAVLSGVLGLPGAASALGVPPSAQTGAATNVKITTATVNATVDPLVGSTCVFKYGTTTAYGATVPCDPAPPAVSVGAYAVFADLTGLTPGTEYHFEVVLSDVTGTTSGGDATFTTLFPPPTASTGPATAVTGTAATLNGTVNLQGATEKACVFQVGTSTDYGSNLPCASAPAGAGDVPVSLALSGLTPGTVYHYRLAAATTGGVVFAGDQTLTTLPLAVVSALAPSSVTVSGAQLTATVDPQGQAVLSCAFVYGAAGGSVSQVPCASTPSAGGGPQAVAARLAGLRPATAYSVQVVVTTIAGTASSAALQFRTLALPRGSTRRATRVSATTADVHAVIDPAGQRVLVCLFQFGVAPFDDPTSNAPYTLTVPCHGRLSARSGPVAVSTVLRGLAAHTIYYVRVLAKTEGGVVIANAVTFRTHNRPRARHHAARHRRPVSRRR